MNATQAKKPPSAGGAPSTTTSGRRTPASNTTTATNPPNRSPSRTNGQMSSTTTTSSPAGVRRERSVRTGGPISARAAARKPADIFDDDAKAEMQAKMDDLQELLRQSEAAQEEAQKQAAVLQVKLDEARKEQGMLEESFHERDERMEELENERKESIRARRELEQINENQQVTAIKDKERAQAREEELHATMLRMKETLAQRELRDRSGLADDRRPSLSRSGSFRSNDGSTNPEAQFAPPSSIQRSDSRSSSRLLNQKDKVIEGLRLDIADYQIKLTQAENKGDGSLQALEKEISELKMQNGRLLEENESYQVLITDKTLNGDFGQSDMLGAPINPDNRPSSRMTTVQAGTSLADELEGHDEIGSEAGDNNERRLQAEVNSLKDSNKALTLYINNIVSRLLQHDQFEQILDKTPDLMSGIPTAASAKPPAPEVADTNEELPPPPPPKDELMPPPPPPASAPPAAAAPPPTEAPAQTGAAGLLQRAKSVMGARGRRPQSTVIQPDQMPKLEEPKPNEDPSTAPSIPLGRSASRGHRRGNSEWSAATVVSSMYKGPTSPGLSSPTSGRSSFFATTQPLGAGSRVPSSGTVPTTISEGDGKGDMDVSPNLTGSDLPDRTNRNSLGLPPSGNFAPVDITNGQNYGSRPESHDSSHYANNNDNAENQPLESNPSSPPRSTTSSGERDTRQGGAVMMGSKPRPLRLVQGAKEEDEKARKAANRGSWFGWMNKGGEGGAPQAPTSGGLGRAMSVYGRSVSGEGGQQQQGA